MLLDSIILKSDSYKYSHHKQIPENTEIMYSYFESRGGRFEKTEFFGLQYLIKKYLAGKVVTKEKVDRAEKIITAHMGEGVFNRAMWEHIITEHDGRLPISIKAVPEGLRVDIRNVLMTVENTDPKCASLTNFFETLLTHIWAPTTVATQSYYFKKMIAEYLVKTSGEEALAGLEFKLHDFGYRGVSSDETAATSGAGHLLNFLGTDTMAAVCLLFDYYNAEEMPAFSIPASEHSTMTIWGKENERLAMANMLEKFPKGLVACVSDSYDIYHAIKEYWGHELKDKIMSRDGTLVVRPDSGDPVEVVLESARIICERFGYTLTKTGHQLFPPQIRLIQGDGIDFDSCKQILEAMDKNGYSTDNIAFGSGGGLLQKLNRDTMKFAFKCSWAMVDGSPRDVYKDPVTQKGKKSKKGRLKLVETSSGYQTMTSNDEGFDEAKDVLREVFRDGKLLVDDSIENIRKRSIPLD